MSSTENATRCIPISLGWVGFVSIASGWMYSKSSRQPLPSGVWSTAILAWLPSRPTAVSAHSPLTVSRPRTLSPRSVKNAIVSSRSRTAMPTFSNLMGIGHIQQFACFAAYSAQVSWDFETDPEFQAKLDWADAFVRDEIEPLDLVWPDRVFTPLDDTLRKVVDPLKQEVRRQKLWATHLGPELGGEGYGQLKLALLNEILGRSMWAPVVFGCQAPDTGNAEIIAHYGTKEQKDRY